VKKLIDLSLAFALVAYPLAAQSAPAPECVPVGSAERAALSSLDDGTLSALRGAGSIDRSAPDAELRASLLAAQASNPALADQRAGELSDDEVHLILGIAIAIVIIALIV
jgi:hypothetical protein